MRFSFTDINLLNIVLFEFLISGLLSQQHNLFEISKHAVLESLTFQNTSFGGNLLSVRFVYKMRKIFILFKYVVENMMLITRNFCNSYFKIDVLNDVFTLNRGDQ